MKSKTKQKKHLIIPIVFLLLLGCSSSDDTNSDPDDSNMPIAIPTITVLSPIKGMVGTPVTITGTNFSTDNSLITVKFNDVAANEITFSSVNQISTMVPSGATTGAISVTIGEKTAVGPIFTIEEALPAPTITSISPLSGLAGTSVVIKGANFGNSSIVTVKFNDVPVNEVLSVSSTEIIAKVPVSASNGPVAVKVASQEIEGLEFTVETPVNFKIAFFGDSEIGAEADAVLNLVKNEGAQVVVHPGDLDYVNNPKAFDDNINGILGTQFPYFYSVGNHDDTSWNGSNGYQSFLESRFERLGIVWQGQLGVLSSFSYQGISFVSSAPDELGVTTTVAGNYIRDELAKTNSIWRVAFWHKNQRLMQIGGKGDEAGWGVYEESRKGGALMATGHEHSYCRTHEMSNFQTQTISSTSNTVSLTKDDPSTNGIDEGRSFGFVSGLGGRGIRDAEGGLDANPWWANVYHSNNGGQYGALFGEFNYNGDASLARFYFKDIDGVVRDEFYVRSNN